jgi:ISXO2-like transposase domain
MQTNSFLKLEGEIEADESFAGGLARNMHKWKRAAKLSGTCGAGKAVVMGLLDRHDEIRVMHD